MTNGIHHLGTLRFDSAMVYHWSHTSAHFNIPSLRIYADALRIRVYEDTYKFTRIAKRGRNFTVVATVVSTGITRVGGSLLPILTHMGLGRRAHLGIRHMVNMVGFVIWLENTQGLT